MILYHFKICHGNSKSEELSCNRSRINERTCGICEQPMHSTCCYYHGIGLNFQYFSRICIFQNTSITCITADQQGPKPMMRQSFNLPKRLLLSHSIYQCCHDLFSTITLGKCSSFLFLSAKITQIDSAIFLHIELNSQLQKPFYYGRRFTCKSTNCIGIRQITACL